MKKFLATSVLSISLFTPLAHADFSDVSSAHTHYAAISSLVEQGILEGYSDGSFGPAKEVNRAEALKIILLGMDVEVQEGSSAGLVFSDVDPEDWFYDYVSTAVTLGVVQGYNDGTFKPEQTVNRAEAMKMLLEAANISAAAASSNVFDDAPVEAWFAAYALYAKTWNLQPPQTDGLWHPEEDITRANLAEMVYRLQYTKASQTAFEEASNWLTKAFPTVDITMKVPFSWGYKQEGVGAVFLLDREDGQVSLFTPYANGGTLLLTRYANSEGESTAELFDSIAQNSAWPTEETTLAGYSTLIVYHEEGSYYREWYLGLDNGSLLHIVALCGSGAYRPYLEAFFEAMVASAEYSASSSSELTIEQVVAELRKAINVDGVGEDMMSLLADWELIETDTIGVGTGPVDYYYSPSANVTIKYERSFDVLLDLEEGETSAF